jgi:hypothetical protein
MQHIDSSGANPGGKAGANAYGKAIANPGGKKIAFCLPKYTLRGSDVVLWGYAYFADGRLLNHESWIVVYDDHIKDYDVAIHEPENRASAMELFEPFRVKGHFIECTRETLEASMLAVGIDVCYFYLAGYENERAFLPTQIPSIAHCIFHGGVSLGSVHCVISPSVPALPSATVLPNMVVIADHCDDLRVQLGIPAEAVVFGRYGGKHTFSIQWVHETVMMFAKKHPEVYLIFMNTAPFCSSVALPNVRFLEGTADLNLKRAFINTCDAMMHGRIDGETFGCAIGEFAVCGKPIFTCPCIHQAFGYPANGHLDLLMASGEGYSAAETYVYQSSKELYDLLSSFSVKKNSGHPNRSMGAGLYNSCLPTKVMPIFESCVQRALSASAAAETK